MLGNKNNETALLFPELAAAAESHEGPGAFEYLTPQDFDPAGSVEARRLAETRRIIEDMTPRDWTPGRFIKLSRRLLERGLSGRGEGYSVLM